MLARTSNAFTVSTLGAALFLAVACAPKPAAEPQPSPPPPVSEPDPKPAPVASGGTNDCAVDADCVPASCCHPASCVPAAQKPECTDVMCTMQCAPNTLDCGGRCACEAGACKAIFASM